MQEKIMSDEDREAEVKAFSDLIDAVRERRGSVEDLFKKISDTSDRITLIRFADRLELKFPSFPLKDTEKSDRELALMGYVSIGEVLKNHVRMLSGPRIRSPPSLE